jgi:hypothetical protein
MQPALANRRPDPSSETGGLNVGETASMELGISKTPVKAHRGKVMLKMKADSVASSPVAAPRGTPATYLLAHRLSATQPLDNCLFQ